MKREFLEGIELEGGAKLTKEVIDKIMAENGKDIEKEKAKTTTAEQQRDTYKQQFENVNTELGKLKDLDYEGMKTQLNDLKTKYDTDTKELQDKLQKQDYENKAKEYLSKFNYIDDDVKETVLNKFLSKEFKLDDGKFLGADEYMKDYQEQHKGLFKQEEANDPIPTIVKPTGGHDPAKGKMSLVKAMEYANTHPGVDINTLI